MRLSKQRRTSSKPVWPPLMASRSSSVPVVAAFASRSLSYQNQPADCAPPSWVRRKAGTSSSLIPNGSAKPGDCPPR
jgi:hypothetical protein